MRRERAVHSTALGPRPYLRLRLEGAAPGRALPDARANMRASTRLPRLSPDLRTLLMVRIVPLRPRDPGATSVSHMPVSELPSSGLLKYQTRTLTRPRHLPNRQCGNIAIPAHYERVVTWAQPLTTQRGTTRNQGRTIHRSRRALRHRGKSASWSTSTEVISGDLPGLGAIRMVQRGLVCSGRQDSKPTSNAPAAVLRVGVDSTANPRWAHKVGAVECRCQRAAVHAVTALPRSRVRRVHQLQQPRSRVGAIVP